MASITLQNITKRYPGDVIAVKDFNLNINDEEFVVFVGPSGCGKSTTLRMIAGLEEISDGSLYIGDKLVNNVPPKDRDIAMVFQNYALYPHMSVYKNMAFGLKLRKLPKQEIDSKIHEAAKILDIEHLLDRKPRALSGGQRQRVALGRAMVRDSAVFLLDEPLSNLDAKLRNQMRSEITKLHNRLKTTFVYVTHDQTEAMTMGDRIVVMKDGVIQQVDTPQNLYEYPNSVFVASFIGSPQMNFLKASLIEEHGTVGVKLGNIVLPLPTKKVQEIDIDAYLEKEIILGIRPEDLHNEDLYLSVAAENKIDVTVDIAEMMGAEVFLHFLYQSEHLIAKVPNRSMIQTGDTVALAFDMNKAHLFDSKTEQSILRTNGNNQQ